VLTTHTDRKGRSKLVEDYTLPLTARRCVIHLFTDMAVIDITPIGFALCEIAQGLSTDDVLNATDAPLHIPSGEIPTF